jgi:conjugal transfer pilus assembly protein TraD
MPMISPATVMALPKGQAFALLEGGNLWKIRIPLPTKSNDALRPKNLQEVATEMQRRYLTYDHWWA